MPSGGLFVGSLDRRLQFEANVPTMDVNTRAQVEVWVVQFHCWGCFNSRAGREQFDFKSLVSVEPVEVVIRARAGLKDGLRFLDMRTGLYYYIKGIDRSTVREGYYTISAEYKDNT
jgi:hypothetical protein